MFLYSLHESFLERALPSSLKSYCKEIKVQKIGFNKIFKNLLKNLFYKKPFQVSYYYFNRIQKDVLLEINRFQPDVIICQMIRTSEYLKNYNMAPKILDYVDLLSEGLKRRIPNSNFFFKWLLKIEYKRVLNYEKEIRNYFDKLVIISEEDKKYFCKSDDPKINVIENRVDIDYFHPKTAEKEFDIFFNGNLSYPPNIDATQFIVNKIYPELKKIKPDIRILIAGANPKKKLFKLSNKNIVIKGWIEDVREYYWKSKIFIAPMQIGTGLQNKLLQAMAMRIPCVASELTVKGLSYGAENVVLVAKTPSDYANLIIKLLDDDNFREDVARRGYEFIQKNYKWENVIQKLENIIQETINNKK